MSSCQDDVVSLPHITFILAPRLPALRPGSARRPHPLKNAFDVTYDLQHRPRRGVPTDCHDESNAARNCSRSREKPGQPPRHPGTAYQLHRRRKHSNLATPFFFAIRNQVVRWTPPPCSRPPTPSGRPTSRIAVIVHAVAMKELSPGLAALLELLPIVAKQFAMSDSPNSSSLAA